jgi:molecular chaperone GrpE
VNLAFDAKPVLDSRHQVMASERKPKQSNRIPIRFLDSEVRDSDSDAESEVANPETGLDSFVEEKMEEDQEEIVPENADDGADEISEVGSESQRPTSTTGDLAGGPAVAELVATRAELKRVEGEVAELKDRLARRQADFENYRKRTERERNETYGKLVADIAGKLLPVVDNLRRALDAEASVESSESDEFRHFLSGVDLIYRQLEGALEGLGVKAIAAVGEPFNPHLHEAVVTEETDEYEPDTVMQEIVRGYRVGDKLIRPSLVKVAVKK